MAQGSGSYYDDYMRNNAMLKHCGDKNTKNLLTDRSAYISFLEVQLERVSAACLTTRAFERRLEELESAQLANDQKVGSLSKVFRLNQEYVDQTSQQAQSELAGYTAKVDGWMDKFSAELERQQPRMATLEDQFRQCQEYLPRLAETNDAALHDVKHQAEHEVEELNAHVFALETRIEEIQSCQSATDIKVENLADTTTHKLNMEQRLSYFQQDLEVGNTEVKGVLKKCLDTQHLLSGTVVALQSEVDSVKKEQTSTSGKDSEALSSAVEELRERQDALINALQLLQACALESQQASEDRCIKLDDRLAAAEDSFEARTDDLRRRMLAALEDVGKNIYQDAGTTTENTLHVARKESESHFARAMEFSATLENRLRILEHTVLSLETKVQRSRAISGVLGQVVSQQASEIRQPELSKRPTSPFDERTDLLSSFGSTPGKQEERSSVWDNELFYQERIRDLDERLHRKSQIEEEQRALFPGGSKTSSKSSIASSCYVSRFATEEEFKHDDDPIPRRPRTTLKKKVIKQSSKTAQLTGTPKTLKPKSRFRTDRGAHDRLDGRGRVR